MTKWIDLDAARQALECGTGEGVKIAVLDSGVETTHPALLGIELLDDLAVVPDEHQLTIAAGAGVDMFGHGTAVTSIIRNIAPRAQVGSFRVLNADNGSRTVVIQRAAEEAIDRGYHILNCSFGCGVPQQVLDYKSWVDTAYLKGIHVVAACNNEDFSRPEWPAYFSSVITVNMANVDADHLFMYRHGTLVEFAAKGVDVKLPWIHASEKTVSGSSFAAPRLTALLARLLSVYPHLSPLEAKALLQDIATPWADAPSGVSTGGLNA
jgi:subtilisin family serine protease